MSPLRIACILAFTLVAGSGCTAPTHVTQTWTTPRPESFAPVHRVLVYGVGLDQAHRRTIEDALVRRLGAHHIDARPSYEIFPDVVPKRELARPIVAQNGFDGMLVMSVRRVGDETHTITAPSEWAYYGEREWVIRDTVVRCETALWEVRNGGEAMVWVAETRTMNPENTEEFVRGYTSAVVPALEKAGMIANARSQMVD